MRKEMDCAKILRQIESAVGASKIGIDIIDPKYNIRYIDPTWKKIYGDPAGKKCYRYFMGRNSLCAHCGVREAFRTKKITVKEEVLTREGNKPIRVTTVPFRDDGEWLVSETNVDITDMKCSEQALKKAADNWRQTFDSSPDMIMMLDPKNTIVKANRAVSDFLRLPPDKIIGRKCYRLIHGTSAPISGCPVPKAIRSKRSVEREIFLGKKRIWAFVSASPVLDEKGKLIGVVHTVRDITGRKKIDSALHEESELRRLTVENMSDGLCVCHEATKYPYVRFTIWNNRMTEITGYTMAQINKRGWYQTVYTDPGVQKRAQERMHRMRLGDDINNEEWEITRADGKKRLLAISTTLFRTSDGCTHALALMRDITDRKMAEDAMKASENKYRLLFEESNDAIFVADARTRELVDCNKKAEKMTGYSKRKILCMRADRLHPRELVRQTIEGFIKQTRGLIKTVESQVLTKSGRRLDVSISTALLNIAGRKLLLGVFRDITEHKKAEEVLKRDARELERLVGARSAELLEAQDSLHKSKRLADVGRLSATIAHELRSPFAAIRTAGYNIKMKSHNPRLDSHLANIDKKILEADQIIKNLLYYSSIKMPHRETFYFCRMMDECVELSKQIYRSQKVSIKRVCECGRDLKIEGDPLQLKEVFNNLINNSYESFGGKKGGIEIIAKTGKGFVNVRIKDNGSGVNPKNTQKIFEPFFTTKAKGMGLGLPLCSQIVSLHNGTIKMTGGPGKGTVVEVRLPLKAKVEKSPKKLE